MREAGFPIGMSGRPEFREIESQEELVEGQRGVVR